MNTRQLSIAVLLALALGARAVATPDGIVDNSFDFDGRVRVPFDFGGGLEDVAQALALQGEKILVAGYAQYPNGDADFALARLLGNGQLDTSFDGDGKRTVWFDLGGTDLDVARALHVQADGRILAGGLASTDCALARLLPADGALDPSFGTGGKRTFAVGEWDSCEISAIVDAAEGKILVAGTVVNSGQVGCLVGRLLPSGATDTTFGISGFQVFAFPVALDCSARSMVVDGQQRIWFAGIAEWSAPDHDFMLARLLPHGGLDTTFAGYGMLRIPFDQGGDLFDAAYGLALDAKGRAVVVGVADGDPRYAAMARVLPSGVLDTSFAGTGKRVFRFLDFRSGLSAVATQSDGKIVVAGFGQDPADGERDFGLARLDAGGNLDPSFGSGGLTLVSFVSTHHEWANDVLLAGGKVVAVGAAESTASNYDFGVLRLWVSLVFTDGFETASLGQWSSLAP